MDKLLLLLDSLLLGIILIILGFLIWFWNDFSKTIGIELTFTKFLIGLALINFGTFIILVDERLIKEEKQDYEKTRTIPK